MKKLLTLFLAIALIASLGMVASAADYQGQGVIKMGTAVVDAQLDPAYTGSLYFTGLGTGTNGYDQPWSYTAEASIYLMYDSNYLYIFAEVIDDDVFTKGPVYCMGYNPHANDCIEFRLNFQGTDGDDNHKVSIDAYGFSCFGLDKSQAIIDYASLEYATEITDVGYNVEVAIPCSKGQTDMIKAGKLGFTYQLNDITSSGGHQNFTTSFYGEPEKNTPFYALSTEKAVAGGSSSVDTTKAPETTTKAPETTTKAPDTTTKAPDTTTKAPDTTTKAPDTTTKAPDTTTKAPDTTTKAPDDTTTAPEDTTPAVDDTTDTTGEDNPSTFDPIVVAVALTAASGAAFVVSSKKKH